MCIIAGQDKQQYTLPYLFLFLFLVFLASLFSPFLLCVLRCMHCMSLCHSIPFDSMGLLYSFATPSSVVCILHIVLYTLIYSACVRQTTFNVYRIHFKFYRFELYCYRYTAYTFACGRYKVHKNDCTKGAIVCERENEIKVVCECVCVGRKGANEK